MKNGLEAKSEPANFKRIFLLDTGVDTFDSLPVFCSEDAIIVHAKSRCPEIASIAQLRRL